MAKIQSINIKVGKKEIELTESEAREMKSVDLSKKYYRCDYCGQMKPWTPASRTWGSIALDEYYGLEGMLILCSDSCAKAIGDPETALKKKLGKRSLKVPKIY